MKRKPAPSEGNPALKEKAQKIARLERAASDGNALAFYKIGAEFLEVRLAPSDFGCESPEDAEKQLSAQAGIKRSTLYNRSKVAEAWDESDFKSLVKMTGPKGFCLSFSHFVAVAEKASEDQRKGALQTAIDEELSVRKLYERLGVESKGTKASGRRRVRDTSENEVPLSYPPERLLTGFLSRSEGGGVPDVKALSQFAARITDLAKKGQHWEGEEKAAAKARIAEERRRLSEAMVLLDEADKALGMRSPDVGSWREADVAEPVMSEAPDIGESSVQAEA